MSEQGETITCERTVVHMVASALAPRSIPPSLCMLSAEEERILPALPSTVVTEGCYIHPSDKKGVKGKQGTAVLPFLRINTVTPEAIYLCISLPQHQLSFQYTISIFGAEWRLDLAD